MLVLIVLFSFKARSEIHENNPNVIIVRSLAMNTKNDSYIYIYRGHKNTKTIKLRRNDRGGHHANFNTLLATINDICAKGYEVISSHGEHGNRDIVFVLQKNK